MFEIIPNIAENSTQQTISITLNGLITIGILIAVITDLSLLYLLKLPQALRYMKQQSPNQDIAEDLYQGLSELMNSVPLLDLVEIKLK